MERIQHSMLTRNQEQAIQHALSSVLDSRRLDKIPSPDLTKKHDERAMSLDLLR